MALKDPPTYVGLDPALIYGIHDLKQKTYQRLLQLIGWMWVTRKTGNPLGTSVTELAERWGIAERTAYHTLQGLAEKGYIGVTHAHGRVYITKGQGCSFYNTPGEPAHTQQVAGGDEQHAGGAGGTDRPRDAAQLSEPDAMQEPGTAQTSCANSSSVVVVGSDSQDRSGSQLPQQPTTKSAVQELMEAAGMFSDKAAELAADPWVTEDLVEKWVVQLRSDGAIRSVGAVLYSNLKAHREPPEIATDDDYWQKLADRRKREWYTQGEWADIVER